MHALQITASVEVCMHAAHTRASAGGSALGSILQVAAALRAMLVAFQYVCIQLAWGCWPHAGFASKAHWRL